MWPFKRRPALDWITVTKKVRRTIYLSDGTTIVSYIMEQHTKLPEWPDAPDYHFETRASNWDTEWVSKNSDYLNAATEEGVVVIRREMINKITYKVEADTVFTFAQRAL